MRSRLEDGISYTEFSYVLLQSMDYLDLYRDHGVTLQFGGSDQWEHHRRRRADPARRGRPGSHAIATPLITKADGTKYGKTEGGALWLDPEMLSPYAFYQFWLNAEDAKVGELLRVFTFLAREEIEALEAQTAEKPFLRAGQKALAEHVTTLVHGPRRPRGSRPPSAALFGGGDLDELGTATLGAALREAGSAAGDAGDGLPTSWTSWSTPACRRARARHAAPSPRAAPTSTTSGSPTPRLVPSERTCSVGRGSCCGAARRTWPASRS